jgi:hypothetical protein
MNTGSRTVVWEWDPNRGTSKIDATGVEFTEVQSKPFQQEWEPDTPDIVLHNVGLRACKTKKNPSYMNHPWFVYGDAITRLDIDWSHQHWCGSVIGDSKRSAPCTLQKAPRARLIFVRHKQKNHQEYFFGRWTFPGSYQGRRTDTCHVRPLTGR